LAISEIDHQDWILGF